MAIEVAKYQFQSWVRKGISTQIKRAGRARQSGRGAAAGRARHRSRSACRSTPRRKHPKPFALIGPGDIIGIQRDMIVRTEPRHGIVELRAELPRVHRVLRRRLSLALHARRNPTATSCGRGCSCWC